MSFIEQIIHAYHQRGLDPQSALQHAQIAPKILGRKHARVTALQMEWMSEAAMRELDDEALGWFRRRLPWGSYGMLVRASLTSPNLRVALQRWCRHHGLLSDDITLALHTQDNIAHITLTEHPQRHDLGAAREFCVVSTLRNALGVACWLIDSRIPLLQARFHYAAPEHADAYAVLFDGPSAFASESPSNPASSSHTSSISFDAGYLDLPVRRDEAALQAMLKRALLLTVRPYRRDRLLGERIRSWLMNSSGDPTIVQRTTAARLAQVLHLSERSLHRQLKAENTSLQALKDQARRDRACQLLQRSPQPIKQIANAVGFENEKSFIRAFKAWTGLTPGQWRAEAHACTPARSTASIQGCRVF